MDMRKTYKVCRIISQSRFECLKGTCLYSSIYWSSSFVHLLVEEAYKVGAEDVQLIKMIDYNNWNINEPEKNFSEIKQYVVVKDRLLR